MFSCTRNQASSRDGKYLIIAVREYSEYSMYYIDLEEHSEIIEEMTLNKIENAGSHLSVSKTQNFFLLGISYDNFMLILVHYKHWIENGVSFSWKYHHD